MAAPENPDTVLDKVPNVLEDATQLGSQELSTRSPTTGTERPNIGSHEREYWHDIGSQFRLRMDNLRTMHLLNFSKALSASKFATPTVTSTVERSDPKCGSPPDDRNPDSHSRSASTETSAADLVDILDKTSLNSPGRTSTSESVRNPHDPLQCLPDDILLSIFSYLPYPDIVAAERVSTLWFSYLLQEPRLHRWVSFLNSKHQISLKTLRTLITITEGRISSLEFNASTLMHLTPLAPVYPHVQRLVINQETGYMGTIFQIALRRENSDLFYNLPSLRTAIFQHGLLLNNEVAILLSIAPNLEELECRSAWVMLDLLELLDHTIQWKLKRLRIEHYSERVKLARIGVEEAAVHAQTSRAPTILRFLPSLEQLALGVDSFQVMDLSLNTRLRYMDFLPGSSIVSFIQPPSSLRVCLNAPALNRLIPDPTEQNSHAELWKNPPAFTTLSLSQVPTDSTVLPRALCNSYTSLVAFHIKLVPGSRNVHDPEHLVRQQLDSLPEVLHLFQNLRHLDISDSDVDDIFLARLPSLSLEYLCLAGTKVTSSGVLHFLTKARGSIKEINLAGTQVDSQVIAVAATITVRIAFNSAQSIPIVY